MIANKRHIATGVEFDHYFPKPTGKLTTHRNYATIDDTVSLMEEVAISYQSDTAEFAHSDHIKKGNLKDTLAAIDAWMREHIQYKLDATGTERIESPRAAWHVRKEGIDCDGYSVFISTILLNLLIEHYFKVTKYNGLPNWQHVYVIVPKGERFNENDPSTYYTLDIVKNRFNDEHPGITDTMLEKVDGIVNRPILGTPSLNGLSGLELNVLSGLDFSEFGQDHDSVYNNNLLQLGSTPRSQAMLNALPIVESLKDLTIAFDDHAVKQGINGLGAIGELLDQGEVFIKEALVDPATGSVYGVDANDDVYPVSYTHLTLPTIA